MCGEQARTEVMKPFVLTFASGAILWSSLLMAQTRPVSQQPDITREEARARAQHLFAEFDLDDDGVVTRKEAKSVGMRLLMQRASTGRDVAPGIGGQTLKYLETAFAGMQAVSEQQFEHAFLGHFDEMDANHDGILTAAERGQAHARTGGR